ncbi:Gar1/Naf1 RNA binding region-domain-containing protein [Rhodocollybia butyracea]|uniref:H/ACA ribonucleoprotein complex non-core subunit NAF1 n=1 Tax=Rhodocollybia butyracea TaxID=206335 RepID=A0A9P5UD70_9AGAR|nr:Gar1/Naf1 RNA binding region-domain-containing protein [Rhodocollybia butyracea]
MDSFKVPFGIAQDLLLIQSFVGIKEPVQIKEETSSAPLAVDDDIDSSGSEGNNSEDEIEAELLAGKTKSSVPQSSAEISSESSDSDSDIDSDDDLGKPSGNANVKEEEEALDEEDAGPSAATSSYFVTKNEVVEAIITVPDLEQVGLEEHLEPVGEILNILDNAVIIKGPEGGSDRALDADTLLVFEDRKVLGYIFETFGPTTQPMYQVKFNSTTYPLDSEKVRISRKVYHVPQRSNFVFVRQIQAIKGSDASNMNDEEPADHELEFSDDEAEAEHRRNLKKKRSSSRASSAAPSSRQSTPTPSQMRDADMINETYFTNNAYDEVGPYDLNYDAPVSRPAPMPYNDPYADEFAAEGQHSSSSSAISNANTNDASALRPQRRSANREGSGRRDDGHRGRGRGRGNGNGNGNRGHQNRRGGGNTNRGGRGGSFNASGASNQHSWSHSSDSLSTNNGIIPGLGVSDPQSQFYHPQSSISPMGMNHAQWSFQNQNQRIPNYGAGIGPGMSYSHQQQFVQGIQPHINPLFASQFGMGGVNGMGMGGGSYVTQPIPAQGYTGTGAYNTSSEGPSHWSDQWTVHGGDDTKLGHEG